MLPFGHCRKTATLASSPVSSGLDILSVLREARWRTPLIVMTAFGDSTIRERVEKLGAAMLNKPFGIDLLKQTIREILT